MFKQIWLKMDLITGNKACQGWEQSSVAECLPSILETLPSISSAKNTN